MKYSIAELENYYKDLYKTNFQHQFQLENSFFKILYLDAFENFAEKWSDKNNDFSGLFAIPWPIDNCFNENYLNKRKNLKKEFKKNLKDFFNREFTDKEFIKSFNIKFLNESIICLDRSIYWFLNYCRNLDGDSLNAKLQNLYYSEFFIHLSIGRFLGLAYTWITELGLPIKIERIRISDKNTESFEETMKISQKIHSGGGMHKAIYIEIRKFIKDNITLPDSIVSKWFNPNHFYSLLKEERELHVYYISKPENNPWSHFNKKDAEDYRNFCFLDEIRGISHRTFEEGEYLSQEYSDWGYREHHIGIFIKWMAERLKNIEAGRDIEKIKNRIKNLNDGLYPKTMLQPKKILYTWFE